MVALVPACAPETNLGEKDVVLVFAAASLQELVEEIGQNYQQSHGIRLIGNYAGSNVLAQQIQASRAADVFLSANTQWMDFLDGAGCLESSTRLDFLSNRLVLIQKKGAGIQISDLSQLPEASYKHLAIGNPEAVPAGKYAKAALVSIPSGGQTLWDTISDQLVPTLDVRSAMTLVESDPAVLGIVYQTDAATSDAVEVVLTIPEEAHPSITYCAAAIKRQQVQPKAIEFLAFLTGKTAAKLYQKHGFRMMAPPRLKDTVPGELRGSP